MYELVQIGKKTYYIACPSKIGLYAINHTDVCLIDSGSDVHAAKKVYRILEDRGWNLNMIINTHSHADHIGGNTFLQQKTHCRIYYSGTDGLFIQNPNLEAAYLFGGYPNKDLRNKFLCASQSIAQELTAEIIPTGLEILRLDGHSFSQIGIRTSDDVWFLADAITSEDIIAKYHVIFLCDVAQTLNSLQLIKTLKAKLFVPSHGNPCKEIISLADINIAKMHEIINLIETFCVTAKTTEAILKKIFDHYELTMSFAQNVLVGSTIRSYLSYMYDNGRLEVLFENNFLLWKTVKNAP